MLFTVPTDEVGRSYDIGLAGIRLGDTYTNSCHNVSGVVN
jgi:hypothetical protein